jgi:small subunit ribosomal protein S20
VFVPRLQPRVAVGVSCGVVEHSSQDTARLCYPSRARRARASFSMPNIKQQRKRVRIAAQERLENLHYRSTIKTLTKRLATAAADGDAEAVTAEHRSLEKLIDRAVARGALHRNAAARKKAQASRLAAGSES